MIRFLPLALALTTSPLALAGLRVVETDTRIEIREGENTVFGWQKGAIAEPKGGEKFAASAFIHPLATPSGFELTRIQPSDHLHHFGVWWPWKHVEVDGKKHNCWELQNGEGRQVAVDAKLTTAEADKIVITARNRHEIKKGDAYQPVLEETALMTFRPIGEKAYQLDIEIQQKPAGDLKVVIPAYRYSGFSWRGPASWTGETSRMLTSGGHDRTNANHQPARWVMVGGDTPKGKATMLILSAAPMDGGEGERLRVWGPKQHHGEPFVNFNPVVKDSPALTDPPVGQRRYRLVLADKAFTPEEAESLWQEWKGKSEK